MNKGLAETKTTINGLINNLNQSWETLSKDMEKWGEMRQNIGAYEEQIKLGYILYGISKDTEAFLSMQIEEVAPLVSRINQWTAHNRPGTIVTPSQKICDQETKLNIYSSYKLEALTDWLDEVFHDMVFHR